MPQGTHTGVRVALSVPPRLHEQLKAWADYDGRPVATLCMFLIESALRQAQKDGIAPSYSSEPAKEEPKREASVTKKAAQPDDRKAFTRFMEDRVAEARLTKTPAVTDLSKEDKQELLVHLLAELKK